MRFNKISIRLVLSTLALLAIAPAAMAQLVISELRVRGPNGANDEFIELYNNSGADHTVAGGGTGYGVAASDGTARCVVPNGTIIPRAGHYLCANSVGYSLAAYASGDTAYTTDIPDNAGIAIFNTSVAVDFTLANRLDAVGSTSEVNTVYKEGTGYPALTPFSIDYSFYRDDCGKQGVIPGLLPCPLSAPADTNNNATDFVFVDTNGTSAGAGQRLGAPGPQNLSSQITLGTTLGVARLDDCAATDAVPNQVRDMTSDPPNNATFGTYDFRRTFTNNTGAPITSLRFRVIDLTTFPAPSGVSDLRPRTSTDVVVTVDRTPCGSGTSMVTVTGTTLQQPPSQPNGTGFNGSFLVPSITVGTPLANGASIDVRFLAGVQQDAANTRLIILPETLPASGFAGGGHALILAGDTPPTVTINQGAAQADPTGASPIIFDVVFNEVVTGFDATDISFTGSTVGGTLVAVVSGAGPAYTVSVTGMTGSGTVIASIPAAVVTDSGTNPNAASTSTDNMVTFDGVVPTVTINQGAAQVDPTSTSPIVFDVVFSEAVTGFDATDISFTGSTVGGTLVAVISGAGPAYTVTVTGMTGSGTVVASIPAAAATDVGGNPNAASTSTDNSVTFDGVGPTVTINQGAAQVDPTGTAPITFDVVFNEAVTGFDATDINFAGSTVGGTLVAVVSGAGPAYTVTVTGMTGSGTVVASIPAAAATDVGSNASAASTSTDNSVTFDGTGPTVTIEQAIGQADPANAEPINFTVTFSEPATGFATGDVTLGGTAGATTAVVTGGPTVYNVAVSGVASSGTVTVSVAAGVATDTLGNPNAASTSTDNSVTVVLAGPAATGIPTLSPLMLALLGLAIAVMAWTARRRVSI